MAKRVQGSWVKERWSTAREQRQVYVEQFGQAPSVKEFFRKPESNPLLQRVRKYAVTYDMEIKNSDKDYRFYIPQETFYVYSLEENPETRDKLENDTKQAVLDIFENTGTKQAINDFTKVEVRGLETQELEYGTLDLDKLKSQKSYHTEIPKAKVIKSRFSGKTKSKYDYNLDLWK